MSLSLYTLTLGELYSLTLGELYTLPLMPGLSTIMLNAGLNLFIKSDSYVQASGIIPLIISGNASGTLPSVGSIPLVIPGGPFERGLNLSISGINTPVYSFNNNLNLHIGSNAPVASSSTTLTIWGSSGISFNGWYFSNVLSCYLLGDGTNDGWFPNSGNMNLHLQGVPGTTGFITMFMPVSDPPTESQITLSTYGVIDWFSNAITLHMATDDAGTGNVTLFTRGYHIP